VATAKKPRNAQTDLRVRPSTIEIVEVESAILTLLYRAFGNNQSRQFAPATRGSLLDRFRRARIRILTLGRLPDLFDLLVKPTKTILKSRSFDLVISSFAPRYVHEVASYLKASKQATYWVADFRDLWTQHHQFSGIPLFRHYEKYLEKRYLQQADLITTVSHQLADQLSEVTRATKVVVVPNGFSPRKDIANHQSPIDSSKTAYLVYTGTLYPGWQNVHLFLEGVAIWKKNKTTGRRLKIEFIGNDLSNLTAVVQEFNIQEYVSFPGLLSHESALAAQSQSDAQLFFEPNTGTGIVTGKFYEYLTSMSFIWRVGGAQTTEAKLIAEECGNGVDIGNDPVAIAAKIDQLTKQTTRIAPKIDHVRLSSYDRSQVVTEFARILLETFPSLTR